MASSDKPTSASSKKPYKGKPSEHASPTGQAVRSTPVSIPSKFDTVLYTGPRERKGFGVQGRRFGDEESDIPGPGKYGGHRNESSMEFKHDSISKRGYGGMASREGRFKDKLRYTGPGPGSYRAQLAEELSKQRIAAHNSSFFCQEVPKAKPVVSKEEILPGPGAYNPNETRVGNKVDMAATVQAAHSSAFKACTSSFAGRSCTSLGGIPPVIFLDDARGGADSGKDSSPGPGSYEVKNYGSIGVAAEKAASRPSAAFRPADYLDRFGQSMVSSAPRNDKAFECGVGSKPPLGREAQRMERVPSPSRGVSAPFRSKSPGHAEYDTKELAKAPGPAYYSPTKPPSHRSFHLNARKQYVPVA
ncbi:hypothetical protein DUNSADRAFT_18227 [Dunaliella salina]|uniref:Flagellar associated protein n=1 Tax=Dunaliella salina TaxID=3046 RepID=A0ABQ7GZA4_DUNSA|nr:hypothetical protein DUNSADRAFT_18227 [Dunaliella salina]|eukprot:KAF5839946.1 hypothetical protein DUNSADRAFT_18227 [Dunaliella salina]